MIRNLKTFSKLWIETIAEYSVKLGESCSYATRKTAEIECFKGDVAVNRWGFEPCDKWRCPPQNPLFHFKHSKK
jgi:hypothetical protein